ncbi:carbohydrate kinase [Spiractinospora alimapuensis]|uniref:carbohydrate kinase family protein n=1 Tax=Spiractinospora alimapuensis TaxID=2820884 RepID=UPI001F42C991|nr:carbohydrate kinase [Spiractinospora alimapuensis]QVQ52365.1 carbohydrate kinase [Spiractinospora alimapuensis]
MIIVCGEALIDLMPRGADTWRAIPGGGPTNAAVALTRLGVDAPLMCRLSRDTFGRQLRDYLTGHGVDLRLAVDAEEPTTLAVVGFSESGSADYSFYLRGTADWQWTPAEFPDTSVNPRAIYTGTLAAVMPPGAHHLRAWTHARRNRSVVCYDLNARPSLWPDRVTLMAAVTPWLDTTHVLKVSEEDVAFLAPGREPLDVVADWARDHAIDLVLLTRGADGAVAYVPGRSPVRHGGFVVDVVDTVGAGDTFGAAALARLDTLGYLAEPGNLSTLTDADLADTLRFASAAAAVACTGAGARPPRPDEIQALLAAS